jgi:hypothetical protein
MKPVTKVRSTAARLVALTLLIAIVLSNAALAAAFAGDNTKTATTPVTDLTQLGREGRLRENANFARETADSPKCWLKVECVNH